METEQDDKSKKGNSFFNKVNKQNSSNSLSTPQVVAVDYSIFKWGEIAELNFQRNYASVFIHNDQQLYIFFGASNSKGPLSTIERINLSNFSAWEIVNFQNPHNIELRIDSAGTIFANNDEVYIVGGCVNEKFTDKILKYNFVNNTIFKTEMIIPFIKDNEYYRFWEESNFQHVTNYNKDFNDEDYTYAMFDAKDKVHLFNVRTYKYTIL